MKNLLFLSIALLFTVQIMAQVPKAINFQAIARDGSGNVMANTNIQIRLSVRDAGDQGTIKYQELRALTTNGYGSFSYQIGVNPNFVTIGTFSAIDWNTGNCWLQIDYDPTNMFNWALTLGNIQFVTVPYAFNAETVSFIDASGATNGQVLVYNSTLGKFIPGTVTTTPNWTDIQNKPTFATVATSGSYTDLSNKPTLFSGSYTDLTSKPDLNNYVLTVNTVNWDKNAADDFNGNYNSLTNKPDLNNYVLTVNTITWDKNASDDVQLTGNQTITGTKSFASVTVPTPVNNNDAVNKSYVDLLKAQINDLTDNLIASGTYKLRDIDGNQYNVVKIGTQVWMAENLKTTRFNDGVSVTYVSDNTSWAALTTPGLSWYNNDVANKATYGGLYNWYAVDAASNGNRNVCPSGWHVPSDAEWTTMENYLIANGYNFDGTTSGNNIAKALASTTGWTSYSGTGTIGNTDYPAYRNKSGFNALPAGYRFNLGGAFSHAGSNAYFWSSTPHGGSSWYRLLRQLAQEQQPQGDRNQY